MKMSQTTCTYGYNNDMFYHIMILPALVIIAVLQVYGYVKHKCFQLVLPFKFLIDNDKNRFAIILVFGSAAGTLIKVLSSDATKTFIDSAHWTIDPFRKVAYVLEIAVLHFPLFACIQSSFQLLSAVMGVLYVMLFAIKLLLSHTLLQCMTDLQRHISTTILIMELPGFLCLLGLLYLFVKQGYNRVRTHPSEVAEQSQNVVKMHQRVHVKGILNAAKIKKEGNIFVRYVYKVDPGFQFPALLLATVVVIVTINFQIIVIGVDFVVYNLKINVPDDILTLIGISTLLTIIISVVQLFFFLKNFRKDLLNMYSKFKKSEINQYHMGESETIRNNLFFLGYFMAFSVLGTLIIFAFIAIISVILYSLSLWIKSPIGEVILKKAGVFIYNAVIVTVILFIIHRLVTHFLFKERKYPQENMFVKNIGIYHLYLYFTIFLSLLTGVMACLWTVFFSVFVNILFIPRIDRLMVNPKYFRRIYVGHLAYVSFLKVEAMVKNPVLRCFCQFLLDSVHCNQTDSEEENERIISSSSLGDCHVTNIARNRWFLAVMLHNNPSLKKYRKTRKEQAESFNITVVL